MFLFSSCETMAAKHQHPNQPLVSLCNDYDHYLRCIAQFEKEIAAWLPDYKKWVNTHVGRKVLDMLDIDLPVGEKLRVLGIGSGEGN